MTIREIWNTLLAPFLRKPAKPESEALFCWCPVANLVEVRQYGPKGAETRRGTKHFKPGAKVYLVDAYWGMGAESVIVVGHHRGSKRLITLAMRSAHLTNWRIGRTYSPHIIRELEKRGPFGKLGRGSDEGKRKAEEIVAILAKTGPAASG